jgi:DNA-binding response OmpR family regulator
MAMTLCHQGRFDLVVADNETNKLGGVGLVRQMRAELDWRPQVLLLLARQQDAWLGAWSGADSAILQPADPGALATRVANLLGFPDA